MTEKVADRAVALPFHTHLTEDQIAFIVATMKDASINVGAGAAIYLEHTCNRTTMREQTRSESDVDS